jgi:predicted nucleotidyltransferase
MVASQWIDKMAEHIASRFHPVKILLFGSHAHGTAGPDSDVDLLVILPEVADKRKAAVEIRRSLAGFPVPKDIIVASVEEAKVRGSLVGSILRPALREGKVLYERP